MHELDKLVATVLDDADRRGLHAEDRALAESRQIEFAAADRMTEIENAAKELGRTRGQAADRAREAEADREIHDVYAGAADALWDRFQRQVALALDALPSAGDAADGDTPYAHALAAWAAQAAERIDRPVEVFAARRDRSAVYAALLAAGARDFQVQVERRHTIGFVVRDLDGRTVHDCRPEALIQGHHEALQSLLIARVPTFDPPAADLDA